MTRASLVVAALAALAVLALTRPASAEPVAVKVIEVAGDVAYLDAGARAGLAPGTAVTLDGRTLIVLEVTATTASVRLDGPAPAVGARGTAEVTRGPAAGGPAARTLPTVRPAEAWVAQWPDVTVPAAGQRPTPRPLGGGRPGRVAASVVLRGAGHLTDDGDLTASGELRGRLAAEVGSAVGLDLDVAGRVFTTGTSGAYTPVLVRVARLRLGPSAAPLVEVGRLGTVADQVGALDGVHARRRIGGLVVGALAGLVPGELDTRPRTEAARFGVELGWDDPASRWQPRVGVVALGSTWRGQLDERRLTFDGEVARGALRGHGWGEVASFAADNPWGAAAVEVAAAGLGLGWADEHHHLDADLTYQRPERSLRLAANLPVDWLCQGGSSGPESGCADASWTDLSLSAGAGRRRWSLDGGLNVGLDHAGDRFVAASAFALGELRGLPGGVRLQLGGSGGRERFLDWYGAEAGVAYGRRLWDVALRWRPELVAYTGALDRLWQQGLVVDGRWALPARLSLAGTVVASAGPDRNALSAFTTLAWRPLP